MPAYRGGAAAVRAEGRLHLPGEPGKHGIDAHQGGVLLYDGETGELRPLVDGAALTAVRTAAVSVVATRALARPGSTDLAIIGAGCRRGRTSMRSPRRCRFERVRIARRTSAMPRGLAGEASARHPFSIEAVGSVADAMRGADVVVTVSTAAEPIVDAERPRARHAPEPRRIEHRDAPARSTGAGSRARGSSSTAASRPSTSRATT